MGIIKGAQMVLIRFFSSFLFGVAACILLIRQCFKPYFLNPEKATMAKRQLLIDNAKRINLICRLFSISICIFLFIYLIIPDAMDISKIITDDYTYCVVETTTVYNSRSSNAKLGKTNVIIHLEFSYNPNTKQIQYSSENRNMQLEESLSIRIYNYEKGDYYLVKYLPYSTYGEVVYQIDDISQYISE